MLERESWGHLGELGGRWTLFRREGLGATERWFVREAVSKGRDLGCLGDAGRVWRHLGEIIRYLEGGRWVWGDNLGGWGSLGGEE